MKIALAADDGYELTGRVRELLVARGHSVECLGGALSPGEVPWASTAETAALLVARGSVDEGVFICWSGTGICMAANKVRGVYAALCHDAGAARAARLYNHANVLCLGARSVTSDLATEILDAWLADYDREKGRVGAELLREVEARQAAR